MVRVALPVPSPSQEAMRKSYVVWLRGNLGRGQGKA